MSAVLAIAKLSIKEIFRKKDFYVAFFLIGVIVLWAQSLRFYNAENVSRYLMEIGLALVWFFSIILCAALAARQYPSEVQNRTAQSLLAKPVSRAQFILGKYLGSFLASACAFTLFYAAFLAVVRLKAGAVDWPLAAQAYYLFLLNLAVFAAMSSALSYVMTVSANVTVSLTLYFMLSLYGAALRRMAEGLSAPVRLACELIYFAFPHFEFFDLRQRLIHGWEGAAAPVLGFLTLYAAVYALFFLLLAAFSMRRRPIP